MSTKQLNKFMKEGALVFLLMVTLSIESQAVILDFPVVCEFPEVFFDEIPNAPPDKSEG